MNRKLSRLTVAALIALGGLGAAGVCSAYTYNAHLVDSWKSHSTAGSGGWTYFNGINGLIYEGIDSGSNSNEAQAVLAVPNGVLVGGSYFNSGFGAYDCYIIRYAPDGSVQDHRDIEWNFWHYVASGESDCRLNSMVMQNGKLLVGVQIHAQGVNDHTGYHGAVMRFDAATLTYDSSWGDGSPPGSGGTYVGDDVVKLIPFGNSTIVVADHVASYPINTDEDFLVDMLDANGTATQIATAYFDLGGDKNDRASDAVLEHFLQFGGPYLLGSELYVVGTAQDDPWTANHKHDQCAILALKSTDDGATWARDTSFDGDGWLTFDLPVIFGASGPANTQTHCYTAAALPRVEVAVSQPGILVGGERYYNHVFYPSYGTGNYDTSAMALAKVAPNAAVTALFVNPLNSGYYREGAGPGVYNSVRGIIRNYQGKYLLAGLAGVETGLDANHAPSDFGTMMMNSDFSLDTSWGYPHGANELSIDGFLSGCQGSCGSGGTTNFAAAAEGPGAMALDSWHGRAYIVGNRDNGAGHGNDWMIGVVQVSDRIFASNMEGTAP